MKLLPFEYAVRNLMRSPSRLALSVAGATLVAGLVLSAAAFINGMNGALKVSSSPRNVIILGSGSEESIERSAIGASVGDVIAASVRGIRSELGTPFVSPEIHMALAVSTDVEDDDPSIAVLRGVTDRAFLVHPQVRITAGRAPQSGADEILIGAMVSSKIGVAEDQLGIGDQLYIDGRPWTVSGHFEAPNTVMEAEIWCPINDLRIAAQRDDISCVVVTLNEASDFSNIEVFCARRIDLEIAAMLEADYYDSLVSFFAPIRALVLVTAGLIALGGIVGGLNTMYAAYAARVRELGALQVLGYSRSSIVISILQESLLVASIGALLAVLLGILVLDGIAIRFSMGAFGLSVNHQVVGAAIAASIMLGFLGAVAPAWRCLGMPINIALKAD